MPVSRRGTDSRSVVRHEFAHTMLFNEWFEYPQWYAEGFAELVAAIDINARRKTLTIGKRPAGVGRRVEAVIDWDTLIDERFNAHELPDARQIRAAYEQSWILFHYLTLNEEENYASDLERYFAGLNNGQPSPAAFREAFGRSTEEFWETSIKRYARRPPSVNLEFDRSSLDLSFETRTATVDEIQPLLRFFKDKADARRPGDNVSSLASLPGRWGQLSIDGQCSAPLDFDVGDSIVTINGYYNAGDQSIPALFTIDPREDGAYELTDVTAVSSSIPRRTFRLSIRNENVLCFDRMPVGRACGTIFHRCDDRHD